MGGIARYVEGLVRSRRPRPFKTGADGAALPRTAIALRAARPGSGAPRDEFVLRLHKRLAAELDPPAPRTARGGRRAFLRLAATAGGAAVAGAGIDQALTGHGAAAPAAAASIVPDHGTWQTVVASTDLPDGTVRAFTAGGVAGFVRRAGGRLEAVSGSCTHQGCRLALASAAPKLVCPCHGATFALDGSVLSHRLRVTLTALPKLAVRESNGAVQVYAPSVAPAATAASR